MMTIKRIISLICLAIVTSCSSHVTNENVQLEAISNQQLVAISTNAIIPQNLSQEELSDLLQQYPGLVESLRAYIDPQSESQHPMPIAIPGPNTKVVMPHYKPKDDTHYTMLLVPSDKEIKLATD